MKLPRAAIALALVLLYSGLTLLFTYPLPWHITAHQVGEPGGDALIYQWNLWWVRKALLAGASPFESDFIFYPVGIGLSLHTLGLVHGLLFIPSSALFGDVAASNLILLATFLASALSTYVLARYLGAGRTGAFLAGLAFGFCPYRLARLAGHYDLLSTEWLPLYALVFLKAMDAKERRLRYLLGSAALAAACGYTTLTYLVFLALFSAVYLISRPRKESALRAVFIAFFTLVLLSPLLLAIYRDLTRWHYLPYPGADRYVADLAAYLLPGPRQSGLGETIGRAFDRNLTETTVFPGYLVLVCAAAALGSRRQRLSYSLWIALAATAFVLSLGTTLHVAGRSLGLPLPFALLQNLPLLAHLRAPARFAILLMLALSVLLAASWTHWVERRESAGRFLLTCLAAALLIAEFLATPIPLFAAGAPALYRRIGAEPGDFTVVEVPGIDQDSGRIMYNQTLHGKRILIGTASRVPPDKNAYYFGLPLIRPLVDLRKGKLALSPELIEQERESAPEVARLLGIGYFVVDRAYERRGVREFLERVLPVERTFEDEGRVALRVREYALPANPWSIDPAGPASRMYFESGWSQPERAEGKAFRWANDRRSRLLFRRPTADRVVLALELAALPGLAGQSVEAIWNGVNLGRLAFSEQWSELRWALPRDAGAVERLELVWKRTERASERDPRRLAARVAGIRFEPAR